MYVKPGQLDGAAAITRRFSSSTAGSFFLHMLQVYSQLELSY